MSFNRTAIIGPVLSGLLAASADAATPAAPSPAEEAAAAESSNSGLRPAAPATPPPPKPTQPVARDRSLGELLGDCEAGIQPAQRRSVRLRPIPFPLDDSSQEPYSLHCTLVRAQAISLDYANRSDRARNWAIALQLPLIGLAAGAADTVVRQSTRAKPAADDAEALRTAERQANAALRTVGQIGIAASAFAATRNLLLPQGRDLLFLQGWQGMSCLLLESSEFVGQTATTARSTLFNAESATADLRMKIPLIQAELARFRLSEGQKGRANALDTLAKLQLELADDALAKARVELAAWERRAQVFGAARAAVEGRVESRMRNIPALDYRELLKQALAAGKVPEPEAKPQAEVSGEADARLKSLRTAEEVLSELETSLAALDGQRRKLILATRPYDAALNRVAKCPDLVATA